MRRMDERTPPPIACTLGPADHAARLAWIAALNAAALRGYRRDGARVDLVYDAAAAERVHEFVRRERQCCPFLDFTVRHRDGRLCVTIEATHQAAEAADDLFGGYTRGGPAA